MISLYVPPVPVIISLAGTIRYLSYPEITATWLSLNGQYIKALDDPILFNLIGFKYGYSTINGEVHFALPSWNATTADELSTYPRPQNTLNSNGRNLNRQVLEIVPSAIKAHTHTGSTSADGDHGHSPTQNGRFGPGSPGGVSGGGIYPGPWSDITSYAGHDYHSHSGSASGAMILDAPHTAVNAEPKGYGAILCIHRG